MSSIVGLRCASKLVKSSFLYASRVDFEAIQECFLQERPRTTSRSGEIFEPRLGGSFEEIPKQLGGLSVILLVGVNKVAVKRFGKVARRLRAIGTVDSVG